MKVSSRIRKFSGPAILALIVCIPAKVWANQGELTLFKENFYDRDQFGGPNVTCGGIFHADIGQNVPDLRRDFNYYHCDGEYSLTLEGPSGTTLTLYDQFEFGKNGGYLTIRKTDDRMIWVYEFEDFPSDQWARYEEDKNSGAFEVYYHHAPLFKSNISSIEWNPLGAEPARYAGGE